MLAQIRRFVQELLWSESGWARMQAGFPLAWMAGVLAGAAVILGLPKVSHATYCEDYSLCSIWQLGCFEDCWDICSPNPCNNGQCVRYCNPETECQEYYCVN